MRLLALLAASNAVLGVSAGPALRRQESSSSASSTSTTSSTSTSTTATNALQASTLSDGSTTTFEVALPGPTDATTTSGSDDKPSTTVTASGTGETAPVSTGFPTCDEDNARNPFCQPLNQSDLHVGKTYIVTWNPQFAVNNKFGPNSTFEVKLLWANDSQTETWSSGRIPNGLGHTTVTMEEAWLQGYNVYNMTFVASIFDGKKTEPYDGPTFMLSHAPPNHYPPPPPNKLDKTGLFIGLPLGLAFVAFVVIGLFVGMRKSRTIGIGNIMGRHNRGYGMGKSRRQRLGLGKKGAIRLEERNVPQYGERRGHSRGDSLGSLVSDDGNRPAPGTNHFRDEIERQRTGR